jgi:Raf kinase inhibitor-like YbhB/YbcL family protein
MTLHVTSTAFADGAPIPARHAAAGDNLSPPLAWDGVPADTRSLAVIVDDPDAPRGTWTHWVLYNLPADARGLDAGVPAAPTLPNGARQGVNTGGTVGYDGPAPPPGPVHHYHCIVYALDAVLDLPPRATRAQLAAAMHGHVLAHGEVVGTYRR